MAESIKSLYKPSYPQKYKGDPNNIICRSSWERRFSYWCDHNPSIISWASEEFCIPYYNPVKQKICKYFPDYLIKVKESTGQIKTYVIEVKPKKQTVPPQKKSRITKSYLYEAQTYAVNQSKWKAAEEFCKDRMLEFKIITEQELFSCK
jgi:hypothetical protein